MFITPEVAYVCELLHKYDVLPLNVMVILWL
jgi:hypothetical protein